MAVLRRIFAIGLMAGIGATGFGSTATADDVTDFYKGKRLTLIVPTSAGGGYDVPARALSRHITQHVPGKPGIVVRNMPGAGGKRAVNYVYNVAPKDGSLISAVHSFISFDPLFEGAKTKAKFDARKFNWLGSIASTTSVGVSWHTSPVRPTRTFSAMTWLSAVSAPRRRWSLTPIFSGAFWECALMSLPVT